VVPIAIPPPRPQLLRWPLPDEFVASPAVAFRNNHAVMLAEQSVSDIVESAVYLSPAQMKQLLKVACRAVAAGPLEGLGLDLGSGCGLLAATVAQEPGVHTVLAVEPCEQMVERVIPKVASGLLGHRRDKVVPVLGSFDDLRLPAESVDFIVEIDAFHHSDDLKKTFRECSRVLKPGGSLLCLDRCHPDSLSDKDVERMLSQVYGKEFLVSNAYPPDTVLSRRDNGEHEYRLYEWQAAFDAAALRLVKAATLVATVPFRLALKGCLSVLPRGVRKSMYRTENANIRTALRWVTQHASISWTRTEFGKAVAAPKDTTVFLLQKRSP
jgi:ubiquinone/menaquinone biosynthesis C-methylase UbiE